MKRLYLTCMFLGLWFRFCNAQSQWMNDIHTSSIFIEWDKPIFNSSYGGLGKEEVSAISSDIFLTGSYLINDYFSLQAELPISHFGYERNYNDGNQNSTVIGNIYLGTKFFFITKSKYSDPYIELGIRIPTTPDFKGSRSFGHLTGLRSELSDRFEAFLWDTWSIPVIGNYLIKSINQSVAIKLRLGTIYNIYTGDTRIRGSENELHLLYGITTYYKISSFETQLGLNGRRRIAGLNHNVQLNDFNSFTQVRAGISYPLRHIHTGFFARIPVGKQYKKWIDWGYGITLEVRR